MLTDLLWGSFGVESFMTLFGLFICAIVFLMGLVCVCSLFYLFFIFLLSVSRNRLLCEHMSLFMYTSVMSLWLDISIFSQSFNILLMKHCRLRRRRPPRLLSLLYCYLFSC